MVKIPGYQDTGSVDTGISTFRPISANDDTARAAQRFASGLGDFALARERLDATIDARDRAENERLDKVRAQRVLLDLHQGTTERLKDAVANMDPADPKFYEKWRTENDRIHGEAYSKLSLNGPLAPAVEMQFQEQAVRFNEMAMNQAAGARTKYVQDTLTKTKDTFGSAVLNGTMTRDEARVQAEATVREMGLPAEAAAMSTKHIFSVLDGAALSRFVQQNGTQGYRELRQSLMPQFKPGTDLANPIYGRMLETSERHGLPAWALPFVAGRENAKLDPTLKNPNSTAFGLFQMIDSDWKETGIPKTADPGAQIEAAAIRLTNVRRWMESRNIDFTPGNLYAAHLLGRAGFGRLQEMMAANPNASAEQIYAQVAGARVAEKAFDGSNGQLLVRGATVAQTMAAIEAYSQKGMKQTEKMLGATREMPSPDAPLVVGGVTYDHITRRDAQAVMNKSLEQARHDAERMHAAAQRTRVDGGVINGYDTDDRKSLNDRDRERQTGDMLLQGNPDAHASAMNDARTLRFVSRNVSAAAEQMIENPDYGMKLKGYEIGRAVHNSDPTGGLINSSFDPRQKKKIEAYTSLVNVLLKDPTKVTPEEQRDIIGRVERAYQKDQNFDKLTDADKQRYKDQVPLRTVEELASMAGWDKSRVGNAVDWVLGNAVRVATGGQQIGDKLPKFGRDDTIPHGAATRGHIEKLYQQQFLMHFKETDGGSDGIDVAKTRAATDIKKILGVSQLMGNVNRTMYPPEQVLPQVGGSHNWVKRQVEDFVAADVSVRNKDRKVATGPTDPKQIWLIGDGDTGHDVHAGRPPSYRIAYIDQTGQLQEAPARWRPSLDQLNAPAEREAQQKDQQKRDGLGPVRSAPAPAAPITPRDTDLKKGLDKARAQQQQRLDAQGAGMGTFPLGL